MTTKSRETILKKIRKALSQKVPIPFPQSDHIANHFSKSTQDLELEFAENFSKLQGKFSYCVNTQELYQQLHLLISAKTWTKIFCPDTKIRAVIEKIGMSDFLTDDLANCDASITGCESLVARTGSIVLTSAQSDGRNGSVYAPVHVCIAFHNQLLYDLEESLTKMTTKYKRHLPSLITFATGPSRTADIEKTLVVGVHGPKEVFCFFVDEY